MNKKLHHISIALPVSIAAIVMTMISCGKQLDEIQPHNQTEYEKMFSKPVGFQRATEGAYSVAMNTLDGMFFIGDGQSNNLRLLVASTDNTEDCIDIFNFIHSDKPEKHLNFSKVIWDDSYTVILNINEMLAHVKSEETDPVILQAKAEALFLRALTYFNLVRVYGMPYYQSPESNPGVPVFTETTSSENPVRASVKEVYQQIVKDLNAAIPLFNTDRGQSYGSKYACYALLSRVYLFMGGTYLQPDAAMNQEVINNATEVIDNGGYVLLRDEDYKNYYSQHMSPNSEDIYVTDNRNRICQLSNYYVKNKGAGGGFCSPSPDLLKQIDDNDLRWNHYFYAPFDSKDYPDDTLATVKYGTGRTGATMLPGRQIRLIEMYLNRAEAYAKLKTAEAEAQALVDLNEVRTRAGLPADNTLTEQALFDEILKQRRIELAFEGHYSFDLFRNGLTMQRTYSSYRSGPMQIEAASPKVVLRIPGDQINLTPSIKQNEQ